MLSYEKVLLLQISTDHDKKTAGRSYFSKTAGR